MSHSSLHDNFSLTYEFFYLGILKHILLKVLGGPPQGKYCKLKHYTTIKVKQQSPSNTCVFYVCISMLAFVSQPDCVVSLSVFIYFNVDIYD
jgi:hypothetical protein